MRRGQPEVLQTAYKPLGLDEPGGMGFPKRSLMGFTSAPRTRAMWSQSDLLKLIRTTFVPTMTA